MSWDEKIEHSIPDHLWEEYENERQHLLRQIGEENLWGLITEGFQEMVSLSEDIVDANDNIHLSEEEVMRFLSILHALYPVINFCADNPSFLNFLLKEDAIVLKLYEKKNKKSFEDLDKWTFHSQEKKDAS